jgi:DNA-directed RNA polymerase specialized sigma24 family protein
MPVERVIDAEALFAAARNRDHAAFADWMGCVERPIQDSLRRFARVVDLEVVMQETFARMWVFACDPGRRMEGPNAALRFAIGVARNVAREEVRRARLGRIVSLEELADPPEPEVFDAPPADPGLRAIIQGCLDALPRRPREAILARIEQGHVAHDRSLAQSLQMSVNTFLQNIVRARSQLARCLKERGAPVEEFVS